MDYFSPAVQLGLTATPKRTDNVDTYDYFGEPVYTYSLKEGINDGYLTPFKVKQISTTLDEYVYTSDDELLEGEVEEGKRYGEDDFNRVIEIREREKYRVQLFMDSIDQGQKSFIRAIRFFIDADHIGLDHVAVNLYGLALDVLRSAIACLRRFRRLDLSLFLFGFC